MFRLSQNNSLIKLLIKISSVTVHIFVKMRRYLLDSETIDVLCLVYSLRISSKVALKN